ncbi:methyl-accepting chemotaxis protein [bacterium]|nr:methyl-accepting chemotaxis protein [bacterium]
MISSTLFFSKFYILLPIQNMIDKVQIEANDTLQTTLDLEKRCMSVEGSIIRQSLNQKKLISLLEEISKDITSSYNTSKQAFHVSESSDKQSDDGLEIMEQMIQSIHETLQASHDTEKVILSIEEIAKKSDVLTLNAFVEVNRAGESGKTFAVIAEEIRKLTSKSTHAVQSTSNLVKSAIEKSKQGVLVSQALSETLQNLSKNNQMAFLLNSQLEDLSKIQDDKINKIKEFAKQVSTVISKGNESTQDNAKMIRGLHVKTTQLIETIDDLHHLIYRNR